MRPAAPPRRDPPGALLPTWGARAPSHCVTHAEQEAQEGKLQGAAASAQQGELKGAAAQARGACTACVLRSCSSLGVAANCDGSACFPCERLRRYDVAAGAHDEGAALRLRRDACVAAGSSQDEAPAQRRLGRPQAKLTQRTSVRHGRRLPADRSPRRRSSWTWARARCVAQACASVALGLALLTTSLRRMLGAVALGARVLPGIQGRAAEVAEVSAARRARGGAAAAVRNNREANQVG